MDKPRRPATPRHRPSSFGKGYSPISGPRSESEWRMDVSESPHNQPNWLVSYSLSQMTQKGNGQTRINPQTGNDSHTPPSSFGKGLVLWLKIGYSPIPSLKLSQNVPKGEWTNQDGQQLPDTDHLPLERVTLPFLDSEPKWRMDVPRSPYNQPDWSVSYSWSQNYSKRLMDKPRSPDGQPPLERVILPFLDPYLNPNGEWMHPDPDINNQIE